MDSKKSETFLKFGEMLKTLSKCESKNLFTTELYSQEMINRKRRLNHLLEEAKDAAFEIMNESRRLVDSYCINYDDFEKVLLSMDNLLDYLCRRIGGNDIMKEVRSMEKILSDPLVKQQGVEQGKKEVLDSVTKKLLDYGMSSEDITAITEIQKEDLEDTEANF